MFFQRKSPCFMWKHGKTHYCYGHVHHVPVRKLCHSHYQSYFTHETWNIGQLRSSFLLLPALASWWFHVISTNLPLTQGILGHCVTMEKLSLGTRSSITSKLRTTNLFEDKKLLAFRIEKLWTQMTKMPKWSECTLSLDQAWCAFVWVCLEMGR